VTSDRAAVGQFRPTFPHQNSCDEFPPITCRGR
jgi:hypothetical protein